MIIHPPSSHRPRPICRLLAGLLLASSTGPACSVSNLDVAECASDNQCQEAFGSDYACSPSGSCFRLDDAGTSGTGMDTESSEDADGSGDSGSTGGLEQVQLADACGADSIPVLAPSPDFITIDTRPLGNDFDELSCLATRPSGNDGFFALDLAAGERWHFHVRVTDDEADPSVYVLRQCDERTCQAGDGNDLCGDGTDEHVSFVAPESGRYYVGIDSRSAGGAEFELLAVSPVCGNGGEPEHSETCDDGNIAPFDGCDALCRAELTSLAPEEVEPNDDQVGANVLLLDAETSSIEVVGSVGSRCDFDNFFLEVPDGASISARLTTAGGQDCPADVPPLTLRLLGADARTLLGEAEVAAGEHCPSIDATSEFSSELEGGNYYIRLFTDADAPLFEYTLEVTVSQPLYGSSVPIGIAEFSSVPPAPR